MNNQTANGEPTRYFILKSMLNYMEENEVTQEWKEGYIDFVEDVVENFLDPDLIRPDNQDKAFRRLLKETSILARYLFAQIHSQYTFDSEVFRIVGNHFLRICDACIEEDTLISSFGKMDCK